MLAVVVVLRVGKVAAGAGDQVVDPREVVILDEVEVQAEALNVETVGIPVYGPAKVLHIAAEKVRDVETGWIEVAAVEQNAALALGFPLPEPTHHVGA